MKQGDEVELKINEDFRKLNARLHSAGHLLDVCVRRMGLDWVMKSIILQVPGKGYHFEKGAYVEYVGAIEPAKIDETVKKLNELCTEYIEKAKENVDV